MLMPNTGQVKFAEDKTSCKHLKQQQRKQKTLDKIKDSNVPLLLI